MLLGVLDQALVFPKVSSHRMVGSNNIAEYFDEKVEISNDKGFKSTCVW